MRGYTTTLVPTLLAMLREKGFSVASVVRELELPAGCAESADVPVTPAAVRRLGEAAEKGLEDPFVGLHAAERMSRGAYGLMEFIARSSQTLRQGLEAYGRFSRLINDYFAVSLEPRGADLALHQRYVSLGGDPGRHQHEFTMAVSVAVARHMVQRPLPLKAVWFVHPAPPRTDELVRYFGTDELRFSQSTNGFLVGAAHLELPVNGADPNLHRVLEAAAQKELRETPAPDDLAEQVRHAIRKELQAGAPRVGNVAKALALSPRTLQRRLAEEKLAFQTLADEVRSAAARHLLEQQQLGLAEVAFRLGYTNLGAFIRAFKGWTGQTPGEFREKLRR